MNHKKTSGGLLRWGVEKSADPHNYFSFSDRDETVSSENARPTGLRALEGEPDGRDCHGVRQRSASRESKACLLSREFNTAG